MLPDQAELTIQTKRTARELQAEKLRHWRHLLGNEHFQYFLKEANETFLATALNGALDESLSAKDRRRQLARYRMAKEVLELVQNQERAISSVLERASG